MMLYHGSNVAVQEPRILESDRKLDFGTGFYLTSSFEQAKRWAELTVLRRSGGVPVVSCFTFADEALKHLKTLTFTEADEAWLKCTAWNRKDPNATDDYDLVTGPVADDRTMPVISAYYAGIYDMQETLRRLLPQRLKDQFAFKTELAIGFLSFKETNMSDEMDFFIFLLEHYACDHNVSAADVLREWDTHGITQKIFDYYFIYHQEALTNAYMDIDSLLATGEHAY